MPAALLKTISNFVYPCGASINLIGSGGSAAGAFPLRIIMVDPELSSYINLLQVLILDKYILN
jgi:hypothetical protein